MNRDVIEIIVIGLVTYYFTIFVFFYKCNVFNVFAKNEAKKLQENQSAPEVSNGDLIDTKVITLEPQKGTLTLNKEQNNAESLTANNLVVASENEEFEIEYAFSPEEEEFLEWKEAPEPGLASGVTFEELKLVVNSITNEEQLSETNEKKAIELIRQIHGTEMLQQIVEQIDTGEVKMNRLLDKYTENQVEKTVLPTDEHTTNFDINDYLPA